MREVEERVMSWCVMYSEHGTFDSNVIQVQKSACFSE